MKIFTLGYQGLNLQQYISVLEAADVAIVVDVRETAWSYKRGFSKFPLREGLSGAGIDYVHLKSAGNPSKNRKTARTTKECLSRYRRHLLSNPACLDELCNLLHSAKRDGRSICLTCFERHPHECHRSILVTELENRLSNLEPIHLSIETADRQLVLGTTIQRS